MQINNFSKEELIALLVIFAGLVVISVPNFKLSIERSRDSTRMNDLGSVEGALDTYFADFGEFPGSTSDGKIIACKRPGSTVQTDAKGRLIVDLIPCEWGQDGIYDLSDSARPPYIFPLPKDPQDSKGIKYIYISNGRRYQLFGSLEDSGQAEYNSKVVARGISCGARVCNFGRSYGKTPLDITLDQYEQTLQK